MAKEISKAKSRVSSTHTGVKKVLADLTGIHEENGVKAVPLDENPIEIQKGLATEEYYKKIEPSDPPPAHVKVDKEDEIERKINSFFEVRNNN